MGNGNTGLKSQFGVGDPKTADQNTPNAKDAGSDKQAQDFQAAFQQEQGVINGHLQYTAANAEASGHDPLSARRDGMFTAFQSALAKIDRTDPSKAQGAIDKVLGDVRALSGEVATFRQRAEKAKTDWDSRQGKYDDAVRQVEELEAWEDAKAPALRGLVDGIRKQVNQRQYAQATTTLDQLLPKLAPIYEEYLRQKEAKPQYEQKLAEQSARLEPLKAAERPSQPMTTKAGEADAALQEAKGKADTKDFVAGLESTTKATGLVDELDALTKDPQRQQYLADSSAAAQTSEPQPEPAFKTLEADWMAISEAGAQAQPLADSGDYAGANQALADSKTKRADFQTKHDALVQQKQSYDDTLAQLQPRLQAVSTSEAQYATLQPMQQDLAAVQTQMESAATAEDFGQALTQAQDLTAKVGAIEQAKAEIDQKKQEYETALAALQPKLPTTCPVEAKLSALDGEITTLKGQMEAAATSKDYASALELAKQVGAKADEFQKALAEFEKNKQAYEAALNALQPKLPTTCPVNPSLAERHSQIMALKGQMEAAATSLDYAKALELAKQLTSKVDAYQKAVKETPPSPEKVKEVQDLITSGKKEEALQKAMEVYGVDKSQAKKIVYDSSVSGEAETSKDGTITVGDKSFSSPGWLASSAAHEAEVHVNKQAKAGKWYTGPMGTAIQEVQAYDHELANAHKYNLTEAEIKDLKKRRKAYYDQLNGDYKTQADGGNYDMKPGEEGL